MENTVIQHTFFDQSQKIPRFSIKNAEPQMKQKNPRWSEKKQQWQRWLQPLTFCGNWAEKLYSVQPLSSCSTVSINTLFNRSLHHITPKHIVCTCVRFSD